ncbi:DUF6221 family protein [Saccharopolyspora hattusasensis]|uniref:DUF6221 family protein n=1 Tax=Saccharopolyspora hattusasensis TaxID=1128679 RepID=UPI003D968A2B
MSESELKVIDTAELVPFLRARYAELEHGADERTLRRATWLRDIVDAIERLKARRPELDDIEMGLESEGFHTLIWVSRRLAVEFADHPDYREAWRP